MKEILRYLIPALVILVAVFVLVGCRVGHYTKEDMNRVINDGRPYLEQYVKTLPEGSTLESCQMLDGYEPGTSVYGNYYLSKCVRGDILVNGVYYNAVINLEDLSLYSDYYGFDINESVKKQLIPYAAKYGYTGDFRVENASLEPIFHSHIKNDGKGNEKDVISYMPNVIPVTEETDPEKLAAQVLTNARLSGFMVYFSLEDGVFDSRIIADYLRETGNYVHEKDSNIEQFYRIEARRPVKDLKEGDLYHWFAEMNYCGDLETMECMEMSMICKEAGVYTFLYRNTDRSALVSELGTKEFATYECPFTVSDNMVTFSQEISQEGILLFKEKPEYKKITGTFYHYEQKPGNPQSYAPGEDVELKAYESVFLEITEALNGFWYLRKEGALDNLTYNDPLIEIVFEK